MESTHFHDNRYDIIENRVLSYQPNDDGTFNLSYLFNFEGVGPGGLYTTIADLFRWDQNLYNNQFTHSPNLNETLYTRGVLNNGDTLHYAFALQFGDYKGLKTVGHSGSFMGFRADYLRFPYENFSVALLCNLGSINPRKLSYQVADILLADKIENYLSEYAGEYTNTDLNVTYRIEVNRSQLKLKRTIPPKNELTYESPDVFSIGGWSIEFQRDDRDEITGFSVDSGRARNVTFHRE